MSSGKKVKRSASLKYAHGRCIFGAVRGGFSSFTRYTFLIYGFQVVFWALPPILYHFGCTSEIKCRSETLQISYMAQSTANNMVKKLIQIDVSSDTVCPWCCVGKKNLDSAIASSKLHYDFKIVWYPFFLNPSAPTEGVNKKEFYRSKFGSRADQMHSRMMEVFKNVGLDYNTSGLTGDSMDSHRLIYLAGQQDLGKQHDLVEELFLGYFTQGKYIGDRQFLVESANKVGVEGAVEFLQDPDNGRKEVHEELKKYSANISGVPYFKINGKHQLSGAQPPETFMRAFSVAAAEST